MPDPTNPEYYKVGGIETIDFINAKKLGFNRGNAVKYISRAGHKEKAQEILDLKKALWYVKMALHTRDPEKFPDPREE